jgi:hypothetical protein
MTPTFQRCFRRQTACLTALRQDCNIVRLASTQVSVSGLFLSEESEAMAKLHTMELKFNGQTLLATVHDHVSQDRVVVVLGHQRLIIHWVRGAAHDVPLAGSPPEFGVLLQLDQWSPVELDRAIVGLHGITLHRAARVSMEVILELLRRQQRWELLNQWLHYSRRIAARIRAQGELL